MPSPKDARKISTKKSPGAKEADIGQTLAKRKSQDFKDKIAGWNETGAGVAGDEDGVLIVGEPDEDAEKGVDAMEVVKTRNKNKLRASAEQDDKENASPKTPTTPKTPDTGNKGVAKQVSARKASREIDYGKKVWVRRRSKQHADGSPDLQPQTTPDTKPEPPAQAKEKVSPNVKQKDPPNGKQQDTPDMKRKDSPKAKPKASPSPQVGVSKTADEGATPKKRVVSDTHWRKDRTPKDDIVTPTKEKEKEKESPPRPRVVRRSVVSVGLKVPPSVQDFKEDVEQRPSRVKPLRRRSPSRSASGEGNGDDARDNTPDFESSSVKIYIKRRRKSKAADQEVNDPKAFNTSESSVTMPSSLEKAGSITDITTPDFNPMREYTPRINTTPRVKPLRRSVTERPEPDKLDKPSSDPEDVLRRVSRRRSKNRGDEDNVRAELRKTGKFQGRVPDKSEIPEKEPHRPIPKVFGNRIEGWLASMPDDPFVEQEVPDEQRQSFREAEDAEGTYHRESRNRRIRRTLAKADAAPDEANEERTPIENSADNAAQTLKRSSAQRSMYSPIRDRPNRASDAQEADTGNLKGHKDRITEDSHSPGDKDGTSKDFSRRRSKRHTYGDLNGRQFPSAGQRLSTIASVSTLHSLTGPRPLSDQRKGAERHRSFPEESVLSRASDGDEPARNTTVLKRRLTKHTDLMSVLSLSRDDDHDVHSRHNLRSRRARKDTSTVGDLMNEVSTDELTYQRELRTLVDGVIPVLLQYVVSQKESTSKSYAKREPSLTQPIVEMGVALERLKASHKRIPMHDPNELLLWAQNTTKVYADYLKVWRLGFNDIVVSLAPAEKPRDIESSAWDDGLQRNQQGELLGGDGERVDVAYLLKRPLVRVKNLCKTFKGISQAQPSVLADDMVTVYQELVTQARHRSNDEQARLEDEAAAAIDPSRARDPCNLAPLGGVNIDPTRRVKARDFFDMELFHSNGQQLGCRIETIIRDDGFDRGTSGDVLFCEVSSAGRWLLFPPVLVSNVSARRGSKDGEIIVMIRGVFLDGTEWRELMSLQSSETQGAEWIEMLGSSPMPPRLNKQSSFNALRSPQARLDNGTSSTESELPIGEQAWPTAPKWDGSDVNNVSNGRSPMRSRVTFAPPLGNDERRSPLAHHEPGKEKEGPSLGAGGLETGHRRSKSEWIPKDHTSHDKPYGIRLPPTDRDDRDEHRAEGGSQPMRRPPLRKRTSSVPSMDRPTVQKLRNVFQPETPNREANNRRAESTPIAAPTEPTSAPSKLQKRRPLPAPPEETQDHYGRENDTRAASRGGLGAIPSFTPAFLKRHRRTSSPLKHEYEPSTATESSAESELSEADDYESITSESSADEQVSTLGELKDFSKICPPRPLTQSRPPPSPPSFSINGDSVGPSESASQAPYRTVPPTDNGCARSVACIFSWSDRGSWDSLHPEECEIVVMPGVIEAFDLAQAHAVAQNLTDNNGPSPSTRGVKPLVALELTPWVPLRRGTALDISIRSPPTSISLLRNCSNIMFRSRSPEECEKLYNLINRARIDNPTWIALQNARGPVQTSNWAEIMDRRNAERSETNSPSWLKSLSRKGSTYRSKGTRSASIAGSQSSVGTLGSAFSALRQFSGSNRIFNIAKSTIMSKQSTRSSYSDSLSSGAATPLPIDPSMGTPVGITNAKIRLYQRETTTKWRDLGHGRLTIMLPPRPDPSIPADPRTTGLEKRVLICGKKGNILLDVTLGESCFERVARTGIAVSVWEEGTGPNGQLGHAAATGGVISSKSIIYMIQMKSERDAAYTFSMVGKLRY